MVPVKIRKPRKKRAHVSKKQFLINMFTLYKQIIDQKVYVRFEKYQCTVLYAYELL